MGRIARWLVGKQFFANAVFPKGRAFLVNHVHDAAYLDVHESVEREVGLADASLRARPMRRVTGPLAAAGARFDELEEQDRLPIRVNGVRPLRRLAYDSPHASAQVKSALLLAGLTGDTHVRVTEPGLSRDHTERLLAAMGARVATRPGERPAVVLEPSELNPLDFEVPGDPSSAAFFLGLGAILGRVRTPGVGLNPTRIGFFDAFRRMGVRLEVTGERESSGEPVGDIHVEASPLAATRIGPEEVPALLDEVPLLAALAATARGVTRFAGIGELRVKETDRVAAMAENLRSLGVEVEEGPESLAVTGTTEPLQGTVRSFHDHRIAMAFGVLGALPANQIHVEGADAVDISYPGFWNELERAGKELTGT
ncbi:MAG TPA: 3-phosphoshikimate 1-carboxyvinyltransferase [Longimicrobiales bacterium]|nr:3-phosphoshikimate 1-carboxyvinyltransferase [Longimicrobiales bacterium]